MYIRKSNTDIFLADYDDSRSLLSFSYGDQTGVRIAGERIGSTNHSGLLIKYQGVTVASIDSEGNYRGQLTVPGSWAAPQPNSLQLRSEKLSNPTLHITPSGQTYSPDWLRQAAVEVPFGFHECHRLDGSGSSGCKRRTSFWDRGIGSMHVLLYNFSPGFNINPGETKSVEYYYGNEYIPYSSEYDLNLFFSIYNRSSIQTNIDYQMVGWHWDSQSNGWVNPIIRFDSTVVINTGAYVTTQGRVVGTVPKGRVDLKITNNGASSIAVGVVPRSHIVYD